MNSSEDFKMSIVSNFQSAYTVHSHLFWKVNIHVDFMYNFGSPNDYFEPIYMGDRTIDRYKHYTRAQ